MAQIIRTDGTVQANQPASEDGYTLAELRAAIGGGYIDILHLQDGRLMIVDEEGKLKDLPVNAQATELWRQGREGRAAAAGQILGDALVCTTDEIN